jgi:hypothetical protein
MVHDEDVRNRRGAGGEKSLENDAVPKRKDRSKDGGKDTFAASLSGSFEGSPASASASASAHLALSEAEKIFDLLDSRGLISAGRDQFDAEVATLVEQEAITDEQAFRDVVARIDLPGLRQIRVKHVAVRHIAERLARPALAVKR